MHKSKNSWTKKIQGIIRMLTFLIWIKYLVFSGKVNRFVNNILIKDIVTDNPGI